ncbi:MAG: PSD1 and planctomycete cytochrome C domain-containing protein [Verrucomicrobiales bacterium]
MSSPSAFHSILFAAILIGLSHRARAEVDFGRDVLPILSTKCASCHGGVKKTSGFTFTDPETLFVPAKSGVVPIVPGKPGASELIARVGHLDPDERMPPEGDPLEPGQIAILKEWIGNGAGWGQHWAFAPRAPGLGPRTKDIAWPLNGIDQYVLAKLEATGIEPSPEADRYTLIRRVALDLTGLPPTIAEVDAFVTDRSPDAYEKIVDQFLASPHFGERWARHWLDQARYADSDGYEKDNARDDAWLWRQWVIDSLNRDQPFDQFTTEQIAGDLIPDAKPEQRLATAFHRQTLFNREGGVDPEEDRTKRVIDRATTTATTWLGLTMQCTKCHDHPYDPIRQREFYEFYAFFNNADESSVGVPRFRPSDLAYKESALEEAKTAARAQAEAWLKNIRADLAYNAAHPPETEALNVLDAESSSGAKLELQEDGSLLVTGAIPDKDAYTLRLRVSQTGVTALKLEVLPDNRLPKNGPGRAKNGNFVLEQVLVDGHHLESATADYHQQNFHPDGALKNAENSGWAISPQMGKAHHAIFSFKEPITMPGEITVKLVQNYGGNHVIGRFRLSAISGEQRPVPAELRSLDPDQSEELEQHYFAKVNPTTAALTDELVEAKKRNRVDARVIQQRSKNPRATYIFHRGDFLQPQKELGAIQSSPPALAHRFETENATRLDLARWLVADENPLTARVVSNVIWSHLFGGGLVPTPDDFGTRGTPPSHPRLLDWLAEAFIRSGWRRKQLIKTILMSRSYRQSSAHRPELAKIDANNRLLHRQNRPRVEAEIVRDLHLSVSGLLSKRIGGESVFPPIPADVAALSYASSFKWKTSSGDDRYRRGMYTFFKRTAPDPNLITFDCPDSNLTVTARSTSNTPLMALATLQNEVFHEAAQAFARNLLENPTLKTDTDRLTHAFRSCLARPPAAAELTTLTGLLNDNRTYYQGDQESANQLAPANSPTPIEAAAWVATLRIITNLDEFIVRN